MSNISAASAIASPTLPTLTIDEKRQVVYSSLLRYGTEAVSLRERALNRAVLGALIGSTVAEPFRIGTIQQNLHYRSDAPEIRVDAIQERLVRLIEARKVEHTELRKNHAYFLTLKGADDVRRVISSSEELFAPVLSSLLRDTTGEIPFETGATVFRKFVFECFARFGNSMAKNVTGHMSNEALLHATDVEAAFNAAVADRGLTGDVLDSLRARCREFLRSSDSDSERLKFHLTQGYYFTQLLGFDDGKFNPLNEQAFSGSVFFLDTNVLLAGILYMDENGNLFREMVQVAKRIGIELRVTRATINEARAVAADHLLLLKQIIDVVPEELAERTKDRFLQAYLQAREVNRSLTPEDFLEPFERLARIVKDDLGLKLDDRTEEEIIAGRDVSKIAEIMNEAAITSRGFGKSESTKTHDVCHYLAVQDLRITNSKAWFLTRDRTLEEASPKLDGNDAAFCFQLMGFLHSISPFLTTVSEEQPFADIFSSFLEEQVFPIGNLFDAKELALMAVYHEDVMSTHRIYLLWHST